MGPVSEVVAASLGSGILVELGVHTGFELTAKAANDLVFNKPLDAVLPIYSERLETSGIKVLLITLKYKHLMDDAALGFYRSSVHTNNSLFASVKDYIAVEKGWFSPYLFASARRPIIPRTMTPDVVFCHGPFLLGDYRIGKTLLEESALVIALCDAPPLDERPKPENKSSFSFSSFSLPSLSNSFSRSRTPSPEPALTPMPAPSQPRRIVVLLVGLKPHRKIWTSSARPGESVINYMLCNGCPAIVIPAKVGAPLLAWDGLTLKQLWRLELPHSDNTLAGAKSSDGKFEGVVEVLCEYLELSVDWDRVVLSNDNGDSTTESDSVLEAKKNAVKDAVTILVASAVRTRSSKEVKEEVVEDRCGIAMWRIA
ncbi:hypothetical protein H0H87_010660 [Tephrocybe sp. NHM501043]|nr:hypothetical protein H0H87_010660 [Tephrocybe sp. NHM501043]